MPNTNLPNWRVQCFADLVYCRTLSRLYIITWFYVIGLTNPAERKIIEDVPVHVTQYAPELMLMNDLPQTVSVEVQSTADLMHL
ncbi:MAG: hypothetical protein U5K75_04515 [Ahrensia sp.]|nr:hypothetical protein [Ahrensia sp.]